MSATTYAPPDRTPWARAGSRIGPFQVNPPVVLAPSSRAAQRSASSGAALPCRHRLSAPIVNAAVAADPTGIPVTARRHMAWCLMGLPVGSALRRRLAMVGSLSEPDELLGELDAGEPFPVGVQGPRGRQGSPGRVILPHGWLDDPEDLTIPGGAEMDDSGE